MERIALVVAIATIIYSIVEYVSGNYAKATYHLVLVIFIIQGYKASYDK